MIELADAEPGALLQQIPGRTDPRQEVLSRIEAEPAELRTRLKPALWPLFVPNLNDLYRWRVQLACGCVTEVLTKGKDRFPDNRTYDDHLSRRPLPRGEMWFLTDHEIPKPYREIVEWTDRVVRELPADPIEDDLGVGTETWAKIRRTEPTESAFWRVKLTCGHYSDHVPTSTDWKPGDLPKLATPERAEKMRQEFEAAWAKDPIKSADEAVDRDHLRRMLQLRWPLPTPERDCYTCSHVRRMAGYQRIGWLIPRQHPPKPPQNQRQLLEAKLRTAKAAVDRLHAQLNELD